MSEFEKPETTVEREATYIREISTNDEGENIETFCLKENCKSITKGRVGSLEEAPDFLRDNEYIKHGYRIDFNSTKKVFHSLFILHNESVNIWSHLLGVFMVIVFICYTTVYISSHKNEILPHLNMTSLNEEIKHVTEPVIKLLPNLKNLTHDIEEKYEKSKDILNHLVNKTAEYVSLIDDKIGLYQKYLNCKHCFEEILETLGTVKNSLGDHMMEYTGKIVNGSILIIEQIEDSSVGHFVEDFNSILRNIKTKTSDLISNDDTWAKIYSLEGGQRLERWPVFVMLVSAIICLGCSATFHWFCAHSPQVHDLLNRLDYAGISILIAGSCYPPYYYFFYCEKYLKIIYLAFISIFAISVFFYSLKPDFTKPPKRKLRGILFLTLGLSTAFPILHLALFGRTVIGYEAHPQLIYWYLGGISYVTGALTYIMRFPERFRPGKHDIWGSSHQIFHFFVVLGVIFHYLGCLDAYFYRVNNKCPLIA